MEQGALWQNPDQNLSLSQKIREDFAEHANARNEWVWITGRVVSSIFIALILRSEINDASWLSAVLTFIFINAYSAASAILLLRGQTVSAFALGAAGDVISLFGASLALLIGNTELFSAEETYLVLFPIMISLPYRYGVYVGTNIAFLLLTWFAVSQLLLVSDSVTFPTRILFLLSTLALATVYRHFLDQKTKTLIREAEILRRLNETKSSFVSTVSHELKTPLTAMLAFVSRFSSNRENNLNERQKEMISVIERNGWHLSMLVNDLVDVSKVERGELTYKEADFSMNELIYETIDAMQDLADKKKHTVTMLGLHSVIVHGDHNRYRQVLINLLSNAFKYSPPATNVSVSTALTGNGMEMRVRNSGGGLSNDDRSRMFELFQRIDNEQTRLSVGTGIGLFISRVIVNGHGGEIWTESDSESTTICLTIPAERIVLSEAGNRLDSAA
ncbi:MAG: HAMP domain-containing sensor histidine kinase [Chloroflexi bacterium]|nr:HAMP domain-containing sensor histidine kinase [Chloroflexota bacterium]